MEKLKQRIIDLSYKHKLSHLGSCLSAVEIIDEIYTKKRPYEQFVLSSGHAGLALYVVLEKHLGVNAEHLLEKHGIHPNRDIYSGIVVSTGSLGHGLPIAVGMALAKPGEKIYVLTSDGELAEGSMYESANVIRRYQVGNIELHINYNEWGAYRKTHIADVLPFTSMIRDACQVYIHHTSVEVYPFLHGQDAHYHVMTDEDYQIAANLYKFKT